MRQFFLYNENEGWKCLSFEGRIENKKNFAGMWWYLGCVSHHVQHCSLIGWNFVLSWKRVGWRIHGVSILQLPLSPRPLQPLPAPLSLNVWSAGVVHQRKLQQRTEHESLQIMQIFEDCSQIPEHRDERSSGNHVNLKIFSSTSSAAILQTSMQKYDAQCSLSLDLS